jgi:hypothetical protein
VAFAIDAANYLPPFTAFLTFAEVDGELTVNTMGGRTVCTRAFKKTRRN